MNFQLPSSEEEVKSLQDRYRYIYILLAVSFLIFSLRLWYLQILKGSEFRYYSEQNLIKFQKLYAPRGRITDRNGIILVDNHPGFEATVTPQYVEDLEKIAKEVSVILNISEKHIIQAVQRGARQEGRYRPVRIKDNLTRDEVARVERIRLDHPGLDINMYIKRTYPFHQNGAQLLGYVGEISRQELPVLNRNRSDNRRFRQGDIIGKSGVESRFDEDLRGEDGLSFVQVDARGRIANIRESSVFSSLPPKSDPIPGNNLQLTIDADIQIAAFNSMQEHNFIGGVVALDPRNGEVLSWLNLPSFDPNDFSTGISQSLWSQLTNDPFRPLRNKVIQDHYAPGSTFKPFVGIAALEERAITTNTTIFCPGFFRFGRRNYHCWNRSGHGHVNLIKAMEVSCNVFFYNLGNKLGIDTMAKYASNLGIGRRTGVNLQHEVSGLMPTSEWKRNVVGEPWQPGENLSNAIGQGFVLTTPLQLAISYGAIGMEGPAFKPQIIQKVLDPEENVLTKIEPEVLFDPSKPDEESGKPLISKQTYRTMKEALYAVTNGPQGTARWYKLPGVKMAGKTGTVQNFSLSTDQVYSKCDERPFRLRHHGWFVGYAPYDNPKIAVAVLAEHGCAGSRAAPVVRDIMLAYFQKYHPELLDKDRRGINPHIPPPAIEDFGD